MKNNNLSLLDKEQIAVRLFDAEMDAQRVILVGSDGQQITDSIKEGLKDLKIEQPSQALDPLVIKIPYQTVIKELEIKEIEKQVFIPQYKVIEVEKPIIVPEVRIIEIEKQIIVKQQEPISNIIKYILIVQTIAAIVRIFFEIIHK